MGSSQEGCPSLGVQGTHSPSLPRAASTCCICTSGKHGAILLRLKPGFHTQLTAAPSCSQQKEPGHCLAVLNSLCC